MTSENGPIELELDPPDVERNRLTVAFRALLALPQVIASAVLSIVAFGLGFLGWWGALFTGRLPEWVRKFMVGYIAYVTRVGAYMHMVVDEYPPFSFTAPESAVQLEMPARGRLNRAAVFFRYFLILPFSFLVLFVGYGWAVVQFFVWLAVLITGRMPKPAFDTAAAMLRFSARANAYMFMVTSSYPKELFGDKNPGEVEPRSKTRPLVLSHGGRRLLITVIVVGVVVFVGYQIANQVYVLHMIQQQQHMLHR